ncbi:MAG: cytochrome c biogenesis protein CcsA [Gemmatimonadota bacterium]|nr:cytochrome c biogenesis protein CcsA [Gemmatimonadota bacterium]
MGKQLYLWSRVLGVLALIGMLLAPWFALVYASVERQMGLAQKIFYFHVPSAFAMYAAFFLVFIFSILYLVRSEKRWDIWASCAAEVGLLFCTLVLLTGPIWAKPVWGAWWVWDAQLTLTLVLWLIFIAYMMLKSYSEDPLQSARFRAVLGIIGFLDAPLIHYSTRLWRTQHPEVVRAEKIGLPPDMLVAFVFCSAVFLVLAAALLTRRASLELAREELESLKARLRVTESRAQQT